MKNIIITNRFIIREFVLEDAESLFKLEGNPRVNKYIPGNKLMTLNECKKEINLYIKNYYKGKLERWAIILRNTKEFVGVTGFRYLSSINRTEIGLKILPEFWGRGFATEIGNALIHYGMVKLDLDEIIAMADPNNIRSIKSLENIGMTFLKNGYYLGNKVVYYSTRS
ncbi:MAG: GNAT family N-acetyltransferase [Tissierellia bacterium]|nr:GNAT family N-acetyltransferase [Tissierellia bacterium]